MLGMGCIVGPAKGADPAPVFLRKVSEKNTTQYVITVACDFQCFGSVSTQKLLMEEALKRA
jgi:hypothetical protein